MSKPRSIGIHGLGVYLPDEVRTNDFWPKEVVEKWTEKLTNRPAPPPPKNEAEAVIYAELARRADDPFGGSVERRVMADDMEVSDMETAAARAALDDAGLEPGDIDLLLVYSMLPDLLTTNGACTVQSKLGMSSDSFVLSVQGVCNAFQMQMTLASAMISTGRARRALLVQSCGVSRILPYDRPHSVLFGDGAVASVVGPVSEGRGLLGEAHRSRGALQGTLVTTVEGGRWYDEGRLTLHSPQRNRDSVHEMMVDIPFFAREASDAALEQAGLSRDDVDFYASHQGFPWYTELTRNYAGFTNARALETFTRYGSLGGGNVPLVLATARDRGMLNNDDIVVTHSGGSGITWSSVVLRWGT